MQEGAYQIVETGTVIMWYGYYYNLYNQDLAYVHTRIAGRRSPLIKSVKKNLWLNVFNMDFKGFVSIYDLKVHWCKYESFK